jgi:N6-L-threonylcarbamoyladenine synthase
LFKQKYPQGKHLAVVGGVAANKVLRAVLENIALKNNLIFAAPPIKLCTDNGAMIAWAGVEYFKAGITHSLDFKAKPRWPLG